MQSLLAFNGELDESVVPEDDAFLRFRKAYQRGDRAQASREFGILWSGVEMTLRRVLARVPADEADDLLQQTALAVIEKMETFDPTKGNFMQWVKQILWHKRMDMHRRRVARRTTPVTDLSDEAHHGFDSTADGSPDSADVLVVREEYERVNREIENLRWPVRLAIRMVYDERLTYDEAAAILQTTSAALRVAVSRALHQIRTRLAA